MSHFYVIATLLNGSSGLSRDAIGASRLPDVRATAVITVLTIMMQDFTWSGTVGLNYGAGPSEPTKVLA